MQTPEKRITPTVTVSQALEEAFALHGRGNLDEAERLYAAVLSVDADDPDALHLMGVLRKQQGRHDEAIRLIGAALERDPDYVEAHVNLGLTLNDIRRHEEAIASYQKALAIDPECVEGHYNMGLALSALGRGEEAVATYRSALAINPRYVEAHYNLGTLLRGINRHDEAAASIRQALEIRPDYAKAHFTLGVTLSEQRRFAEAEASYRRALAIEPDYSDVHGYLGQALYEQRRWPEAEASYRQALAIKPDYVDGLNNLGITLQEQDRFAEAEESYRQALAIQPDFIEAHINLGVALQGQGRLPEAEASQRRALAIQPDYAVAHCNLGNALREQGRFVEAEASYRRALAINADYAKAHSNLGAALSDQRRLDEAVASYRRALAIEPDYAAAHTNLGNTLRLQGRLNEAEASHRRALEFEPDFHRALDNLGTVLAELGRLSEAEASYRRALELKPSLAETHSNLIFVLDLIEGVDARQQQDERRAWYVQHGRQHAAAIRRHENLRDPDRILRVGYVSADFRRHSAYSAFSPVILRHERSAFEVTCYSGVRREDGATAAIRQHVQGWRSIVGVSDDGLADQIRHDRIDILVDLSGHSEGNRLLVFARKPAPVQVTGWGHATGTGVETIDYFLADPVLVPPEERSFYAEEVVDLPCCLCYEPPRYLPEVSTLPALSGRPFTFGCINRIEKISDRAMALWGRILAMAPGAQLLIKGRGLDDTQHRQDLLSRLNAAGIGAERLRLAGASRHAEHLKAYHEVDLALDPFPQSGGISTAEALWMGVPVITLAGATVPSRITASILTALERQDWIARSEEEYMRIAVAATKNLRELARTRKRLRLQLAASKFGDLTPYTLAVEAAYRRMWRRWCEQQASSSLHG